MSKILPGTFTVERILDKRLKGSKIEYLVKWDGYTEADNTWEPIRNLENVMYLVEQFEQENPDKRQIGVIKKNKNSNLRKFTIVNLLVNNKRVNSNSNDNSLQESKTLTNNSVSDMITSKKLKNNYGINTLNKNSLIKRQGLVKDKVLNPPKQNDSENM